MINETDRKCLRKTLQLTLYCWCLCKASRGSRAVVRCSRAQLRRISMDLYNTPYWLNIFPIISVSLQHIMCTLLLLWHNSCFSDAII